MNVLTAQFDPSVNQCSPVREDYARVVNHDEDGNEFVTFSQVDYPTIQKSHGSVRDWSLEALLKAGINPDFSIHTGNPTRLEGVDAVNDMAAYAEQMLKDIEGAPDDLPKE